MAREPLTPITFDIDAAFWLQDYLLGQPDGIPPFDWPDPAMLLLDSLQQSGWSEMADPEIKARILWLQTILDAGIDSFVLTASIWEQLQEMPHLIDPDYYLEDKESAERDAFDFVKKIGHLYWVSLAHALPRSMFNIGRYFDGRVLNVTRGNGNGSSVKDASKILMMSQEEWRAIHRPPMLVPDAKEEEEKSENRGKIFKEIGPKKASLYLLRLQKAGAAVFADIHQAGIPADVHAVVLSYCLGAMNFDGPVTRDRALNQLNSFWIKLCSEYSVNNTELYWKLWVFGRRFCRPVNCAICPIRQLHKTRGRIATGGYYAKKGSRTINPDIIVPPNTLDLDPEFLMQYAPEANAPGLRVTEKTVWFVQHKLPGFQLSLEDGESEVPASPPEEDAGFDPFEGY